MLSRRIASTLVAVLAIALAVIPGTGAPASAASNVTCNGGYTSAGPMGTFTYGFSADVRWATGPGINHNVTMVMTYRADGYLAHSEHTQVNGFINFTVTATHPALVQGVDIADEFFIDGVSRGSMFVHPSCRTYAQPPPEQPPIEQPPGRAPGKVTGLKAIQKSGLIKLTWKTPPSFGNPVIVYEVTGSKKATTRARKAIFRRLEPGSYRFRVAAVNENGKGVASNAIRVRVR